HAHDLERRGVEYLETGRAVELHRVNAAVGPDGHRESQVAVQFAAGLRRIVDRAEPLDLGAPLLLVVREAVFRGVGADEFLARPLLVVVDLLVDLRLEPHRRKREIGEIAAAWLGRSLLRGSAFHRLLGDFRLRLASERQQLLLPRFELAYATLRVRKVASGVLRLGDGQRRARTAPL